MIYFVSSNQGLFDNTEYKTISVAESKDLMKSWKMIQFDTEGTGLDCHIAKMLSMQFGNLDKSIQIVVDVTTISPQEYKDILEHRLLIGHNIKYDIKMLMAVGIVPTNVYDTMIAEQLRYLAYPSGMYEMSLKEVAKRYLGIDMDKSVRGKIRYVGLTPEVILYAAKDVVCLYDIMKLQVQYFKSINAMKALQIECLFTVACAYFEFCGVKIDSEHWIEMYHRNKEILADTIKKLNDFVMRLGNKDFINDYVQLDLFQETDTTDRCNIDWASSDSVIPLLKYLGFTTKGYDKKKKEEKESKETKIIEKQRDINPEFADLYMKYSKYNKLVTTYGMQYINAINPYTGRIHTEFRALGTDTGRLACGSQKINEELAKLKGLPQKKILGRPDLVCAYPQIQNLPKDDEVRACFVAEEGNDFVSIDYNSEESRLLASLSGDKNMLEVFQKGYDMHSYVAYLIYPDRIPRDIDIRDIKKKYHDLRQSAKGPEFTFAFLGNWATLVANYGMPKEEAQAIEKNYKEGFKQATIYQEECKKYTESTGIIRICKETGHIAHWWDWEKWNTIQHSDAFWNEYKERKEAGLPKTKEAEEHFAARNKWDKNAVNSTTQGLGAVIFKGFSYRFLKWILQNNLFNKVKFCVPVHDEICIECPKENTEEVVKNLKFFMEDEGSKYCHLLPLPAEPEIGDHWIH